MKIYATKVGAQNAATRLNKKENASSVLFWEVDRNPANKPTFYVYSINADGTENIHEG